MGARHASASVVSKTSLAMTLRPGLLRPRWRQLRAVDQDVNRPTDLGDVEARIAEPIDARHLGAVKRELLRQRAAGALRPRTRSTGLDA